MNHEPQNTIMKYFIALLLTLSFHVCHGQEHRVIEYDFKKKSFAKIQSSEKCYKKNIQGGELIRIKVKNINTYLYNINIDDSSTTYSSGNPSIIASILGGLGSVADIPLLAAGEDDPTNIKNLPKDKLENPFVALIDKIHSDFSSYRYLISKLRIVDEFVPASELNLINTEELLDLINLAHEQYPSEIKKYKGDPDSTKIDNSYQAISKHKYKEKISSIQLIIDNFTEEYHTYESHPITAVGDELNINLTFVPALADGFSKFEYPIQQESVFTNIPVRQLFKLVWSSGLFYSGLQDDHLEFSMLDTSALDSQFSTRRKMGVSALANYLWKPSLYFGLGGHLGFGFDINSERNLMLIYGISCSIGRQNNLLLHAGFAMGKESYFTDDVRNKVENTSYLEVPSISRSSRIENRFQFGLSYKFAGG